MPGRVEQLQKELAEARAEIENLRTRLAWFERKFYRRSSERLSEEELQQLRLFDEAEAALLPGDAQTPAAHGAPVRPHQRRKPKRKPIPDELPREEIVLDIPEEDKQCACGHQLLKIGEDVSEKLDIIPPRIKVLRYVRPRYACRACEGSGDEENPAVRSAAMPAAIIAKGIATAGLLAWVVTGKFCDALPLYRQTKQFARIGVEIPRQTLADWMIGAASACEPVYQQLVAMVKSGPVLQMDETTAQVLQEPQRRNTTKSYMWVMRGGPPGRPGIVFHYAPSRATPVAQELSQGYEGFVQTDGYDVYDRVFARAGVVHVGCWAHARRLFVEARDLGPGPGAGEALAQIAKLYALESRLMDMRDDENFLQDRQRLAAPVLDKLKVWLEKKIVRVPPEVALGKAVNYMHGQWHKLVRYLESPFLTPDTNAIERAIRPFVVGRRAWMFSGSPRGARSSAVLYSLAESARENRLEPYQYFRQLFERLPTAKTPQDYRALLPGA